MQWQVGWARRCDNIKHRIHGPWINNKTYYFPFLVDLDSQECPTESRFESNLVDLTF
jgi:hypothetical protein